MRTKIFIIMFLMLALASCSETDDPNNVEPVHNNISAENLDNKSGGVYFVASPAGEFIFRLSLKNGSDEVTCKMFHEDEYSILNADDIPDWEPGKEVTGLSFSDGAVELQVSLQADGTESTQIFVEGHEIESVSFKSTQDKPVLIYSGHTVSYNTKDHNEENSRHIREMIVLQNEDYFYGLDPEGNRNYWKIFNTLKDKTSTHFTYDVPDINDTWERTDVQYDDDLIYWSFEDDNEFEYFFSELKLYRRFKN